MDFSHVFDPRRWRQRFRSEQSVREASVAAGQTPDATIDEVGSAPPPKRPDHELGSGHGTGDVGGPGWAGWGSS